jgi:hypothetical protein
MPKKAWVVTHTSIDPSREEALGSQVYSSEESLKKDIWPTIKAYAKDERDSYELDEDQDQMLLDVENAKDFWEAYELWAEYASDADPNESLSIEETTIR